MLKVKHKSDEKCAKMILDFSLRAALEFESRIELLDNFYFDKARVRIFVPLFPVFTAYTKMLQKVSREKAENVYSMILESFNNIIKNEFSSENYALYCEKSPVIRSLMQELKEEKNTGDYDSVDVESARIIFETIKSDAQLIFNESHIFAISLEVAAWNHALEKILK